MNREQVLSGMKINGIVLLCSLSFLCVAGVTISRGEETITAGEVKQQADQTYEAFKSYSAQQRDEAVRDAQKMVAELDAEIERIQQKADADWQKLSQATRKQYRETLQELRSKRNNLAEWYGSLRYSSREAWEEVKAGFSESHKRLEQAFEKARRQF